MKHRTAILIGILIGVLLIASIGIYQAIMERRLARSLVQGNLSVLGSRPQITDIHWTAYYIAPVTTTSPSKGKTCIFVDRQGNKQEISLTEESYDSANMESVVVGMDKEGRKRYAYRSSGNIWRELPEGAEGMGNKLNALTPLIHVAAEQSQYPYGSLVYLPAAAGLKLLDHPPLDGYFWVADCGGAVKGDHFDLFVGDERFYKEFINRFTKTRLKTVIYPLPRLPKASDPGNNEGLASILNKLGFLKQSENPAAEELKQAVTDYQKSNPRIPAAEYGNANAATTRWFLTQEVLKQEQHESPSGHMTK